MFKETIEFVKIPLKKLWFNTRVINRTIDLYIEFKILREN